MLQRAQVDRVLTAASKGYTPVGFIADEILTPIKVKQRSGILAGYGMGYMRIVNTVMGGRGKAPRFESGLKTTDTYLVEKHGLEGMVTEEDYDNVEEPFDAEKDETLAMVTVLKLSREKALADAFTSTAVLTQNTTLAGNAQFSDFVNSDPLGVLRVAGEAVYDGAGMAPDTAIMSWKVFNTLKYSPKILVALGYTANRAGALTESEIATVLGVDRLLISRPKYNSGNLGQADNMADIWGKDIVLAVLPRTAAKNQVSLGYNIRLIGKQPYQTSKWDIQNPDGATGLLVTDSYDDMITNAKAAYLIKNAIA